MEKLVSLLQSEGCDCLSCEGVSVGCVVLVLAEGNRLYAVPGLGRAQQGQAWWGQAYGRGCFIHGYVSLGTGYVAAL